MVISLKYRLLDILACPICKKFPLKLIVFNETEYKYDNIDFSEDEILCEEFCGLHQKFLKDLGEVKLNCINCIRHEVVDGILICDKCGRWYPIIEEIPHMLPDELRNENEDKAFLKKFRDLIPRQVLDHGKPWNLSSQ